MPDCRGELERPFVAQIASRQRNSRQNAAGSQGIGQSRKDHAERQLAQQQLLVVGVVIPIEHDPTLGDTDDHRRKLPDSHSHRIPYDTESDAPTRE